MIYLSGITLAILSLQNQLTLLDALATARQNGATVVFDPNLRPRLWDSHDTMRQTIMAAAGVSDILLPSFDDEATFFGDATPDDTVRRYADAGAPLVVVKNGGNEAAYLRDGQLSHFTPPRVANAVDTTAAGDSFNAGFLATYLETGNLDASMAAAPIQSSAGRSRTTWPTTTIAGGCSLDAATSSAARESVVSSTCCASVDASVTNATGSSASRPACISREAIVAICFIAMYMMMTWLPRATPSQSIRSGTTPDESCPVRKVTVWLVSRWVTGMPA